MPVAAPGAILHAGSGVEGAVAEQTWEGLNALVRDLLDDGQWGPPPRQCPGARWLPAPACDPRVAALWHGLVGMMKADPRHVRDVVSTVFAWSQRFPAWDEADALDAVEQAAWHLLQPDPNYPLTVVAWEALVRDAANSIFVHAVRHHFVGWSVDRFLAWLDMSRPPYWLRRRALEIEKSNGCPFDPMSVLREAASHALRGSESPTPATDIAAWEGEAAAEKLKPYLRSAVWRGAWNWVRDQQQADDMYRDFEAQYRDAADPWRDFQFGHAFKLLDVAARDAGPEHAWAPDADVGHAWGQEERAREPAAQGAADLALAQDAAVDLAVEIEQHLGALAPRQREILHLRYGLGWTQAKVAEHLGISQARVSQLQGEAMQELRGRLCA